MLEPQTPIQKRRGGFGTTILLCGFVFARFCGSVCAQESAREPASPIAERPWASMWISSVARVLATCDIIYESIDRPDLSETLEQRQINYREFLGIDRTRPLGMMWTWDDVNDPPSILFFPVQQIDELMKTVTLNGVVDYHQVKENQYEIERPGAPYHAIVRSGYLLLGEDVTALNALRNVPDQMTKELKEKYEIVLMLDQRQMPKPAKKTWITVLKNQFEPWLQPQDDEPVESAVVRRALGKALIDAMDQAVNDIQSVVIGVRIDRKTYQLQMDLILRAEPGSQMAAGLNRMVVRRSEFSALVNRGAAAGLAINWPLSVLGKELLGLKWNDSKGERLDAGIQLIGNDWSDLTIVAGIRGAEATALNTTLPHLLNRMGNASEIKTLERNIANYRKVSLHRIVPVEVPQFLRSFVRPEFEILLGQGKDTVWVALGGPMTLVDRLRAAIDAVEETPAAERSGAVMQGRLSMSKWPNVLPLIDPEDAKAAIGKTKDGFSLTMQPIENGMKIQMAAEEGLIRVIGKHWAKQLDQSTAGR